MPRSDYRILLVEDEGHMVATIELLLGSQYSLRAARSVAEARKAIEAELPDLILLDLGLPDERGTALLKEIAKKRLDCEVVVITVSTDVGTAVEVMKFGARDYIQKPFEKEDLLLCVQQAHDHWVLRCEADRLRSELYAPYGFGNIVAKDPKMLQVLGTARKAASSEATVMITGPSGTGKELVARAVHCNGARRRGPFIAVNCAQFSDTLLESELFGHEKGAFTGAAGQRRGRFEMADRGTLFLDEIGDTSPRMQAKILRAVEMRQFERVGGEDTVEVDIRLIAATNMNLQEEMRKGKFREDLYYRLDVLRIDIPPLSERRDDVEPLCSHFLAKYCAKTGRHFKGITPEALELLKAHSWKGNVRELQNVIEMGVALEDGEWITTCYFPTHILACCGKEGGRAAEPRSALENIVGSFEKRFLEEQLRIHGWSRQKTAQRLGVHRNTIDNKIKKLGIVIPD